MPQTAAGLDELVDLAEAIGLVRDGQLNPGWFTDPGGNVGGMLRDEEQREALLRAIDTLLGEDGRTWAPIVARGGVSFHIVVEPAAEATVVGLGARLESTAPESRTDV